MNIILLRGLKVGVAFVKSCSKLSLTRLFSDWLNSGRLSYLDQRSWRARYATGSFILDCLVVIIADPLSL